MRRAVQAFAVAAALAALTSASAAGAADERLPQGRCERTDALGTARVLTLPTTGEARWGTFQFRDLPLADHELVLTFDDGPRPETTPQILAALKSECVRATFFMLGKNADRSPALVRAVAGDGHSIGSHSWSHRDLSKLPPEEAVADYEHGRQSVRAALPGAQVSLFRFPEFRTAPAVLERAQADEVIVVSADITSEDWKGDPATTTLQRILARIDARRRGVVLFHDVQPNTVKFLPEFLRELKVRGYHVVQIVPAGGLSTPAGPR